MVRAGAEEVIGAGAAEPQREGGALAGLDVRAVDLEAPRPGDHEVVRVLAAAVIPGAEAFGRLQVAR